MGKIKNWEKVKKNIWYNYIYGSWIRVSSIGGGKVLKKILKKEWLVEVETPKQKYFLIRFGRKGHRFPSQVMAIKFAVRWMRRHPNG